MTFRISGLDPKPFRHLYGISEQELAHHNAIRAIADAKPGFPDRIELREVEPGAAALLVNYTHQPAATPYRASHAIFIREGAETAVTLIDTVPEVFRPRMLSLRAFDSSDMLIDADIVDGGEVEPMIDRLLGNPDVSYIHAHYAKHGCFAARIDRA